MAEMVASAFFSLFFDKLASEAMKKIARAKGIQSEFRKLKSLLLQIQDLLIDASHKEIADKAVRRWLNNLQHLAYDIDDLLDELATEAIELELTEKSGSTSSKVRKLIPTCCTNFSLSSRKHGKLDDIATKLQQLVDAKTNLGLTVVTNVMPKAKRYEASLVDANAIVGREGDKKALVQKLLGGKDGFSNKNYSIVPIVGMGGVGKTTLARLLYDEQEVKDHFEVRAWVSVSDEFNIPNISNVIYQSVTGETKEFADLNLLQEALKEKLRNRLFVIVLDDVWSENDDDWDKLEGPFLAGTPGSKIIMTTRKEQLLRKLGYAQLESLSSLSHDDAMCLFSKHALGVDNFDSHPTLKAYGEGLVKKCDGLPLALRSLGRLLRTKMEEEEEWKKLLHSKIWELGHGDKILPVLRVSYNDLSSSLKLLFAYCSLFPKDYLFEKEELILLWMAEGFLHQPTKGISMGHMGHECFQELLSRSFFQRSSDDDSSFVMHDLMNDLATSVAGEFFSRLDIEMKKDGNRDEEEMEKHRHMSFVCEFFMGDRMFMQFKRATSLRTFLALSVEVVESWQRFWLSNKVLNDLLQELPLLRVLRLSNLSISEVPESVGSLKHLRYLNLSNTDITHLPESVCNLCNLQTLIVSGCEKLVQLPNSFSKLKHLQQFDIRDTPLLKKIPFGIGELKSLRTLTKIIVGVDNGFEITELKNLENLHGKVSILGLCNVKNAMEAREANLAQKRLSELEFDWGDVTNLFRTKAHEKEVLNELKPHNDSLKQLKIVSYGGNQFPNWVGDHSFRRLTKVWIDGCPECISLPRLGQLSSLKELHIRGMNKVKAVDQEFLGTGVAFPSLEILSFKDMSGWEVWSTTNSGVVDAVFPCLQELCIEDCPNLVQLLLEALPSLRLLEVRRCSHIVLRSLVQVASSVTKLQIDDISGLTYQLWRGVIRYLGAVEVITIWWCREIRYLWESEAEASKDLVNLRRLDVGECSKLLSLGEKEEDNSGNNLTSLKSLQVVRCNSLEHCGCPDGIESLELNGCDSVTSVSFPTGGVQKLWSLHIQGCNKLLEKELGGGRVLLESVHISDWLHLKSITALSSFVHLTHLTIEQCPNMESFPDHELPSLNSLTHLVILNCQSMDASFPRGFWPPKLSFLDIGYLKKPVSEWGPQNFPTSFVNLRLHGGPSENAHDISQLSHLFPSSLICLQINGFEKVKSVSKGLEHLTSLRHLDIYNCPKTKDLPEILLPSLLSLTIKGCPNLKRNIGRGSIYLSHISRIPCLVTD